MSRQTRHEVIERMRSRYQEADTWEKGELLNEIAARTGYARLYAMWLLNHPPEEHPPVRRRRSTFGPQVHHALVLAWNAANRICAKRLIPFLPTLIESLERHGHLHLSEACRTQLLSMSAATADRLLHAHRREEAGGLSTTRAGTLLKQQIPIRTFQQWNEVQPGFLEADLVAHCGSQPQGSFLSTLTLTDIATGWTECLPLRTKSAEAVLSALRQARTFFPFPILGLDADNGCEFINAYLLAYCEAEQITFTRGRPYLKNEQCHVEQKNGAIVRQAIGYARLEGERAYQQLGEVYQALRLYINGFQPSMKLQAKRDDGRKVRRIYDAAKTPLQRLLLTGVLPACKEQELQRAAQALDPLRLFAHLQALQQALLHATTRISSEGMETAPGAVLSFCIQRCIGGVGADTESVEGACREVVIQACVADPAPSACSSPVVSSQPMVEDSAFPAPLTVQEAAPRRPATPNQVVTQEVTASSSGLPQMHKASVRHQRSRHRPSTLSIEQAILQYLEDQRRHHRRPKTLEWHQMALGSLERYLRREQHCLLLEEITEAQVSGWFAFLRQSPGATGALRSESTVVSYARSARAFCQWAVHQRYLGATPFASLPLPWASPRVGQGLQAEEWEQLLMACHAPKETGVLADEAAARNRAMLWVLFETGMQVTELRWLRLGGVERDQRVLLVRGKGSKRRYFTLGSEGWHHLLVYLETYRLKAKARGGCRPAPTEPLFLSEAGHPLTQEAVTLLFGRLRQRAGITRPGMTASLLRQSFALRYLQAGGEPSTLPALLGQQDCTSLMALLPSSDPMLEDERLPQEPRDSQIGSPVATREVDQRLL